MWRIWNHTTFYLIFSLLFALSLKPISGKPIYCHRFDNFISCRPWGWNFWYDECCECTAHFRDGILADINSSRHWRHDPEALPCSVCKISIIDARKLSWRILFWWALYYGALPTIFFYTQWLWLWSHPPKQRIYLSLAALHLLLAILPDIWSLGS